jgi:hypothetical protein
MNLIKPDLPQHKENIGCPDTGRMHLKNLTGKSRCIQNLMVLAGIILGMMLIISLVSATGGAGASGTSVANMHRNDTPPILSSISPASGPTSGGTVVTIHGSRLGRKASVMFGSTVVTNLTWISPTTLMVTTPPHAAGTVTIVIITPRGTGTPSSVGQFTYQTILSSVTTNTKLNSISSARLVDENWFKAHPESAFPNITSISAMEGSSAGGSVITIHGARLGRGSKVMFGSTPATTVTWVSPTTLLVTVPPHVTGDVNITVTTPRGTTAPSSAGRFTYR